MRQIAGLFLVVALATTVFAQDGSFRSSSQQIGRYRYEDIDTPFGRVTAAYEQIGSIEYGTYSNGWRSSTQQIGRFNYTDYTPPMWYYRRYPLPSYPRYRR